MRSKSTDYSQSLQQKVGFFIYFSSLIVSSRRHRLQMANSKPTKCCLVSSLVNKLRQLKTHGKCTEKNCNLRTLSREYQHRHLGSVHVDTGKLSQMSKGNMHRLETIKAKIFEKKQTNKQKQKTHLLLRILAVISRFGTHLTIVMIFVTQNNFKNGPGISDRLLGFYRH